MPDSSDEETYIEYTRVPVETQPDAPEPAADNFIFDTSNIRLLVKRK